MSDRASRMIRVPRPLWKVGWAFFAWVVIVAPACAGGNGTGASGGSAAGHDGAAGGGGHASGGEGGGRSDTGGGGGMGGSSSQGGRGGFAGAHVQGGAGGTAAGGKGGTGGAGGAGAGGAGGAGGSGGNCATAVENGPCSAPGQSCGSCTDACQFCNRLICQSDRWVRQESFPAPCFACGSTRCQTSAQYCRTIEGGPAGATPTMTCVAIPSTCSSPPTCACLSTVSGRCTQAAAGELTVTLEVP